MHSGAFDDLIVVCVLHECLCLTCVIELCEMYTHGELCMEH